MRKRLFKNLGWKIGGLLLALAMWFHITTEQQFSRQIAIAIDYTNIPQGLVLSADSQKTVLVNITADGKKLFKILYFDNISLLVDLSAYEKPGKFSLTLSREQLTIPPSMTGVKADIVGAQTCDFELIEQQS